MGAKLGRVAVYVKDVDHTAGVFSQLFGVEFRMVDVETFQLRAAFGDHGFEFVQSRTGSVPENGGMLGSLGISVDDVEATRAHIEAQGYKPRFSILLKSGRREYSFEDIAGVPVMLYQESGRFDEIAPEEVITMMDA
jgi:predicted enzyme related to lactoylglutathione lyase